ncbi:MAG: phosphatase [Bacteroides sp.]|nr:phosphatase [Eubacterium sp.]MCM1417176.1 phosphatase [Roseburia sp.]MCM1461203.1 phosphatase [Bacteroides sp.]
MEFIADLHTHTCASTHAYSTVTENARWASEHKLAYLAMTDHGADMPDSPHIWHFYNQRVLPDELFGVCLIRGIEADIIDNEGRLDIYEDYLYECLEWVNVSMHDCVLIPSTKEAHTRAYLGALKNPYVDVLCHTESERFDYDFDAVCKECAARGRLIEVNVNRLNRGGETKARYARILEACARYGTRITVDSDAHFYTAIGDFRSAEELIREIGFPEELVLNADVKRVAAYLEERKRRIKSL